MRRVWSAVATALALALAAPATLSCKAAPIADVAPAAVATLDAGHAPLRGRFDAEADAPRLLVLASPT
jgi:hypothetical protein